MWKIIAAELKYNVLTLAIGALLFTCLLFSFQFFPQQEDYDFITGMLFGGFQVLIIINTGRMMTEKRRRMLIDIGFRPLDVALGQVGFLFIFQAALVLIYLALGLLFGRGMPVDDPFNIIILNLGVLAFSSFFLLLGSPSFSQNKKLRLFSIVGGLALIAGSNLLLVFAKDLVVIFSTSSFIWIFLMSILWIFMATLYVITFVNGPAYTE